MLEFLKKMFDSRDKSVEAHIVLMSLAIVSLIMLAAFHVLYLKQAFDPNAYGQGTGWILGGGGAAAAGQGMQRRSQGDDDK